MRRDHKKRIYPVRALAGVLLYAAVISAVLLSSRTAFAADPAALEQQKNETEAKQKDAEARKKDAKEDLGALQNEQKSLEQNVSGISDSIDSVEAEIAAAESDVQAASRDIESLSADLSAAEQQEESARTQMKNQIRLDYERSRSGGFLSILLGSTSMADFLNRANYASALAEQSRKLVDSYVELQNTIREKSDSLSARQADLASQQKTLTAKREELNTMLGSATDALSAKNIEVADASSDLDAIDQEISGYKAEITSLEAGIADANAALARQIAEQQAAAEEAAKAARQKAETEAANSKTLDEDAAAKEAAAKAAADEAARAKAAEEADAAAKQQAAEQAAAEAEAARKAAEEAAAKAAEAQKQADAAAEASSIPSSAGRVYSADAGDIALLSALCQAEAGNQGYNGLLAVASVVMNRVFYKGGGFPNTLSGVIYQKNQFEPNTRKMVVRQDGKWVKLDETVLEYYLSHPEAVSDDAKNAAAAALLGTRYQNGGADMNQLFFMTPAALDKQTWLKSRTLKDKFVLGGHAFFNVI